MPMKGWQLAYYLKKKNPELYVKAKEIKEMLDCTWDTAIKLATLDKEEMAQVIRRLEYLEGRLNHLELQLLGLAMVKRDSCPRYDKARGICTYWYCRSRPRGLEWLYVKVGEYWRPRVGKYPLYCVPCIRPGSE